jgi:membrane protein YqaA with SNARE-associated domain
MTGIALYLEEFVQGLGALSGGLGLFVIALFDSSLLSLPEVNDVLLVYFGTKFGSKAFYYAAMTTLGSAAGCSLLYALARWKGYSLLKQKFSDGRVETVIRLFRRYGALAVIVPAVLPPPVPFKIFVLSAGVFGLRYSRFIAAVLVGRSIRYFGEVWLARRYGEYALTFLHQNARNVIVIVLCSVAIGIVVHLFFHRRKRKILAKTSVMDARPLPER